MKHVTEAMESFKTGRGAFQPPRRHSASHAGAVGKANVGISNDKGGEMPPRRKTKVSRATLIAPGSVGP